MPELAGVPKEPPGNLSSASINPQKIFQALSPFGAEAGKDAFCSLE
jgi:hypothetical protein